MMQHLTAAARVINNKNTIPILDCFLLEVTEDGQSVNITASDQENTVRLTCPLIGFVPDENAVSIRFCIRARLLMDALKEIPSQPVTLTINMETMEIGGEYANGIFAVVGEKAGEYPVPPALTGDAQTLTLGAPMLLENIASTAFALSDDEIRPVMTGVFFDLTPESMTCVGTDGRKLVRRRTVSTAPDLTLPAEQASFILPKKTSNLLRAMLAKAEGIVTLRFTERQVLMECDTFTINARLVDGHYPNYNSVIPQNNPYTAELERDMAIPALRRILAFADRDSALVKMKLSAASIQLSAQDFNFSTSAQEDVPVSWSGPDGFAIGAKGGILMEVLQNLPADIHVSMSHPGRAMIFTPARQDENVDLLMLLMPMMLNDQISKQ